MSAARRTAARFQVLKLLLLLTGLVLAVRIVQIQLLDHDRYRKLAENQWTRDVPLNPERGNLYDRGGEPLALSVTTWRLGVATSLIEDPADLADRLGGILQREPAQLRREFARAAGRHIVLGSQVVLSNEQKQALNGRRAVTLENLRARIYPHDGVGASLVGFYSHGSGQPVTTGLEHSLDGQLAGTPGLARQIQTGRTSSSLGCVVIEEAVHGQSLGLTLDADLQAICETQLAAAVERVGAVGGSVLVLEPATGDILAAASWPLLPTRAGSHADPAVWTNRNFNWQYEPGSVFKIFTTASLLRNAALDTSTVFDCSDGDFGRFTIHNDEGHVYGDLPLMQAFSRSSNIYFARAVGNLSAAELYRDLLDFGFAQPTSLPYAGQPAGILRRPTEWSGRTKPTLAIGHEVAVTPLQLGLAVCAVANGGELPAPRLVREIRGHDGSLLQDLPPRVLRRVMSPALAALLREALGRVVREGTGVGTQLDWVSVGGKTGTAQKSVDGKGYTLGKYVASFVGMVPLEAPRLVVLTVLDEPQGINHYAALSAVPLFRDIVCEIRRTTDWLTGVPGARTGELPPLAAHDLTEVPDVLYLQAANAAQRLVAAGFDPAGLEREGMIVEQVPAAGTRCRPGTAVTLTVAGRPSADTVAAGSVLCPDFSGLSNREVSGLAARLGIPIRVQGAGYAVRQDPRPGRPLGSDPVLVRMEATWH